MIRRIAVATVVVLCIAGIAESSVIAHSSAEWYISTESEELESLPQFIGTRGILDTETRVLSDSFTMGNLRWLYYREVSLGHIDAAGSVEFASCSYETYASLIDGELVGDTVFVNNEILFEKHLEFDTLSGWSTFEPVDPSLISEHYSIIYDSGIYQIACVAR